MSGRTWTPSADVYKRQVFFYRAAADQEYKTVEVGNDALAQYWNESFGEKPAS